MANTTLGEAFCLWALSFTKTAFNFKKRESDFKQNFMKNFDILQGEELFRQRARTALPFLVRQAKSSKTIFYSQLAKLIGIPHPRNLNHILRAVGDGLIELGKRTGTNIPPIHVLFKDSRSQNFNSLAFEVPFGTPRTTKGSRWLLFVRRLNPNLFYQRIPNFTRV